jgi:hypothetical protein
MNQKIYGRKCGLIGILFWHHPGGTEENHEKVRIIYIPAKIWYRHLPSTSHMYYFSQLV